jgi:hypothetical protein
MSETLFGESGRREERTEWGIRALEDHPLRALGIGIRKGQVEPRPGESSARFCVTDEAAQYGWPPCEVVARTVVTYTSDWRSA